ncbi:MAG: T9SS type A sorting domain-containing protein [Flavobacteriales bacterium]|nr:T9SS type A sorting domain-containing protein [Flavobacteriales bacterium]
MGIPGGNATPGSPCDDGDPNTGDDAWTTNCACAGLPLDCYGTAGGEAFIDNCGNCVGGDTGLQADPDSDSDALLDCEDNCATAFNPSQADFDQDGVGDACDNCVWLPNTDQTDLNGNGIGDACEFATGIGELSGIGGLSIHPNPAREQVFIECHLSEARTIAIYNMLGAIMVHVSVAERRVSLEGYPVGIYSVIALNAEGRPLAHARLIRQ